MRSTPLLSLSLLLLVGGRCAGADMKIRDIRLSAGLVWESQEPVIEFYDTGEGRGTTITPDSGRTRLQPGPRVGITLVESPDKLGREGGLILGFGWAYSHQKSRVAEHDAVWTDGSGAVINTAFRDGPISIDVNAFDLHVGWAYALTRRVEVEVTAFGGIGSMMVDDDGPFIQSTHGGVIDKPNGPYREGGIRLGCWYRGTSGGLIGLESGFLASHGRSALRYTAQNAAGADITRDVVYQIDYRGPTADLAIGFSF